MQSEKGKGKAYVYYFDQRTPVSPDGANHAAELAYVFGNFGRPDRKPRPEEEKLSDLIQTYWIDFAYTGDPNGKGLPEWPNFTVADHKVMRLDAAPGSQVIPNIKQLEALDGYFAWRREQAKEKRSTSVNQPDRRESNMEIRRSGGRGRHADRHGLRRRRGARSRDGGS